MALIRLVLGRLAIDEGYFEISLRLNSRAGGEWRDIKIRCAAYVSVSPAPKMPPWSGGPNHSARQ